MTDREQDREAFEKWYVDEMRKVKPAFEPEVIKSDDLARLNDGYKYPLVTLMWRMWQARAALDAERIAELERERDEARAESDRLWELHHQSVRQLTDARARLARIHACMGDETKSLAHRVGFAEEASREPSDGR